MAIEYERKTAANGNISIGADPSGTAYLPYRNAAGYVSFVRITVPTQNAFNLSILVSGLGRLATNSNGLYFLQVRISSGTVAHMRVNTLIPSAGVNNVPIFGWWKDGSYVYIGAYHPNTTLSPFTATIMGYQAGTGFAPTVGEFYNSTTAPTGWTAATVLNGTSAISGATGVSSLAAIKTQLSTWYSAQGAGSAGYYTLGLNGTISPFATSANLVVEIRASSTANYGTAILTAHNTNGGAMYMMALYNGTWTDPKTVTLT